MPIQIASNLVPRAQGTFGLIEDKYVIGGFRSVPNKADLDLIDSTCLKAGMHVFVIAENTEYVLGTDLSTWTVEPSGILSVLAGVDTSNVLSIANGDTVLVALGKLQAQLSAATAGEREFSFACSDETTSISAGASVITMHAPYDMTITTAPNIGLSTASGSGSVVVDVRVNSTTIFSTKPTLVQGDDFGGDAVIASSQIKISKGSRIEVDIISAGTGAKGLKMYFNYFKG